MMEGQSEEHWDGKSDSSYSQPAQEERETDEAKSPSLLLSLLSLATDDRCL